MVWQSCIGGIITFLVLFSRGKSESLLVIQDSPVSEDCRVMQFKYAITDSILVGHVIESIRVTSEIGCEANCFENDDCMSANLGPLKDGKHLCELSSSDHDIHPEDLKQRKSFIYKPVWNYCGSNSCPQGRKCQTGFTGKGYRCVASYETTGKTGNISDLDKCSTPSSVCDVNAICHNNNGSYLCSCKDGYSGDGKTCQDVNECDTGTHHCFTDDECSNAQGSYSCAVPGPVALFPLNATYGTKEINNRTAPGDPIGVSLAPGPDGKANGSYQFAGTQNSFLEFPNRPGGPLNVRDSMTMLCWAFHDRPAGLLFSYNPDNWNLAVNVWYSRLKYLHARFRKQDILTSDPNLQLNLVGGWKFVGASYDNTSGEAKLWVDGAVVGTKTIGEGLELSSRTQGNVRIGGKTGINMYFKGRITQLQVYNLALTQEQIQTIQKRTQREDEFSSVILSINASYPGLLHTFLEPAVGNNSHWLLCYRASSHGWCVSTFHSRCDGKQNTVTIIKNDEYVFGGYTDIPWDSSDSFGSTSNAFIFSLRNKEGLPSFKSNAINPPAAIYKFSGFGPTFGGGHDIHIADNASSNENSFTKFGHSYSVPSEVQDSFTILAGTPYFSPDELEVFYVDPSHEN